MKNVLSAVLLAIFVFSPMSPIFAQKMRPVERRAARDSGDAIEFRNVTVFSDRRGALIQWEMGSESNAIGYYVYRMDDGVPTLVSEKITLGAGLKPGSDTEGGRYMIYDPAGKSGSAYYVEAISTSGSRLESSMAGARYVRDLETFTGIEMDSLRAAAQSKNHVLEADSLVLDEELETIVTSSLQMADAQTHKWVVAQPGASIMVRKEGIYRVPAAMLQSANFPVGSNSANWRLFLDGVEQSIIVGPGAQYIEFYGKGVDTTDTDLRVYYLIADTTPGKRIPTRTLRPVGGNVQSQNFTTKTSKRERLLYLSSVNNGDAQNHWGSVVSNSLGSIPFTVRGVDFAAPTVTVNVRLQGFTSVPHQVEARVNGIVMGMLTGSTLDNYAMSFQIPTSYLVEGNNSLNLRSIGSGDFSLFDELTIDYKRKYIADQNSITFSTPGYRRANISNFSSANVRVFDITADGDTQLIKNAAMVQEGATFTARLPASRPALYHAVEDSALLSPASVVRNNGSALATQANSANLVIISHSAADFMTAAEAWANYRRGQGFTVKVVDVQDIYDEFNYGLPSSSSIRSFLQYAAQNWQTPPQYALLMGDGSYDPRNYEGFGSWNLVPSRMINTIFGEIASDESLADFNNDGLSELSIGRIPARTAANITTALNKTMAFEAEGAQSFSRGALFAYDEPKGYNFAVMSQTLRAKLPLSMSVTYIDRLLDPSGVSLMAGLNSSKFIVNYSGHGAAGVWHSDGFFGKGKADQLVNTPTIFTMLTCWNGLFIRPESWADSLGERLLNSTTGGSVASWASTTETTPDVQSVMAQRFYEQLGLGSITRIGDLIRDAKQVVPANGDVRYSWALLGDPMLKVR